MLKKIIDYIRDEWKFLLIILVLYIVLQIPLNYYITIGGGISDVSSRIEVEDKYNHKGSFNISYVTQLPGTVFTYLVSYIIPTWERENADDYKYNVTETISDINFRSELDLRTANGTATYWAYKLADKDVKLVNSQLFVIATFEEYDTTLKVQDEILAMDGHSYQTVTEYKEYLNTIEDDNVTIKVKRKNKEQEIEVPLYENEGKKVIGVALQYVKDYETNPKVNIKFESDESGPSGGLITTLEIYNQLTKKDITKGKKIAGTGTIEEDGTIGQIGGIEHKILGAESADADLFLVPSGQNYKDAVKYKKDKNLKIKLVEVKTIEDALEKLEALK